MKQIPITSKSQLYELDYSSFHALSVIGSVTAIMDDDVHFAGTILRVSKLSSDYKFHMFDELDIKHETTILDVYYITNISAIAFIP